MLIKQKNQAVIDGIEYAIVTIFNDYRDTPDSALLNALETAISHYTSEHYKTEMTRHQLNGPEIALFEVIRYMCNYYLGFPVRDLGVYAKPVSYEELIRCLVIIQNSVRKFSHAESRQGYLRYTWMKSLSHAKGRV